MNQPRNQGDSGSFPPKKNKKKTSPFLWIDRKLAYSRAYLELNGTAKSVLMIFFYKRQIEKRGRSGKEKYVIVNNGQIVFSYDEAVQVLGISRTTFARSIDQLIWNGFIEISHLGGGMIGDSTWYLLSDRWRDFGTDKFITKERPKDNRGLGFTAKNWESRTGRQRKK